MSRGDRSADRGPCGDPHGVPLAGPRARPPHKWSAPLRRGSSRAASRAAWRRGAEPARPRCRASLGALECDLLAEALGLLLLTGHHLRQTPVRERRLDLGIAVEQTDGNPTRVRNTRRGVLNERDELRDGALKFWRALHAKRTRAHGSRCDRIDLG